MSQGNCTQDMRDSKQEIYRASANRDDESAAKQREAGSERCVDAGDKGSPIPGGGNIQPVTAGGRGSPIPERKTDMTPDNAKTNNHVTACSATARAAKNVAGNECVMKEVGSLHGPANGRETSTSRRTRTSNRNRNPPNRLAVGDFNVDSCSFEHHMGLVCTSTR
jgi:hypothetical protein